MALPVISGRKVVKALAKVGFKVAGRRGSHIKLKIMFKRMFKHEGLGC